jgi:hypothetical protein
MTGHRLAHDDRAARECGERLRRFFVDVCGLVVSEGALMNMFRRSAAAFAARREQALATLREARFVASDETGVRIEGVNAYHWVFHCAQAVIHVRPALRISSARRASPMKTARVWSPGALGPGSTAPSRWRGMSARWRLL